VDADGPHVLAPVSAGVVVDSGAEPHPAGSVAVTAAVVAAPSVLVPHVDAASSVTAGVVAVVPSDELERFTYAVMSDPVGTIATISQPSPDFSVSFAASEEAS
jgi:hypothetical protein